MDDETTAVRQRDKELSGYRLKQMDLEFDAWFKHEFDEEPESLHPELRDWMLRAWRAAYGRS